MNESDKPRVWFPAKECGWGWGPPACWQGWIVLLAYIVLLAAGAFVFNPDRQLHLYLAFAGLLTGLLLAVCWWKGEKPAWRWGARAGVPPKTHRRQLLFLHLLMGPLLLCFALYFRTHLPPEINRTYGYRTHASVQGQEVWDEAQRFSANAMIVAALITIVFQAVSGFTMKPAVSVAASSGVLVAALWVIVPVTERHLKRHFEEHGHRKAAPAAESASHD